MALRRNRAVSVVAVCIVWGISLLSGGLYCVAAGVADPGAVSDERIQEVENSTPLIVLVERGSTWLYLDDGTDQGTSWIAQDFDDGVWRSGVAELGYGDGGEATVIGFGGDPTQKHLTSYFRRTFLVDDKDLEALARLKVSLLRDDGAVVYINGVEVVRDNLDSIPIDSQTPASRAVAGGNESRYFDFLVDPSVLVEGTNTIAVEVHQHRGGSSDLSFDLSLEALVAKDRVVVGSGSVWRYYAGGESPRSDWDLPGFDDSSWLTRAAPIGYGEGPVETPWSGGPASNGEELASYLRTSFPIEWLELVDDLRMDFDWGGDAVVYLNGNEVVRRIRSDEEEVVPGSYFIPITYLVEGENCIAVKLESPEAGGALDLRVTLKAERNADAVAFDLDVLATQHAEVLKDFAFDVSGYVPGGGGESLLFSVVKGPDWLGIDEEGILRGTPGPVDVGTAEVIVGVVDGVGSSVARFDLVVAPAPEMTRAPLPGINGEEAVVFGVLPDTQGTWDGVPRDEINSIAPRLIAHGPDFVIHVGDVTDGNSEIGDVKLAQLEYLKELLVTPLSEAGINFYPVRGNHDANAYKNTSRGVSAWAAAFPFLFEGEHPLVDPTDVPGGSPESPNDSNFCYVYSPSENVFFVSVDQWNGGEDDRNYSDWVARKFVEIRADHPDAHIFGYSHSGLFATSIHSAMSEFVAGGAGPYLEAGRLARIDGWFSGHNHIYDRSMAINLSEGNEPYLFDFTCGSASEKFYPMTRPPVEDQHLNRVVDSTTTRGQPITYLLVKIIGPFVQIEAYMSPDTDGQGSFNDWSVWDAYTYSRNGHQFTVAAGESYTDRGIEDAAPDEVGFLGTTVSIRDGINSDRTVYAADGERFSPYRNITTGWWKQEEWYDAGDVTIVTDIVSIHGMSNDTARNRSDTYTLVLGYEGSHLSNEEAANLRIAAFLQGDTWEEGPGVWFDAVDATLAPSVSTKPLMRAPRADDPLGSWGIDLSGKAVWARLDYQGDFAIACDGDR